MKNDSSVSVLVIYLVIIVAFLGGWIANIVKLIGSDFDPITGMVIARIIGVFLAPLGSVLGFF